MKYMKVKEQELIELIDKYTFFSKNLLICTTEIKNFDLNHKSEFWEYLEKRVLEITNLEGIEQDRLGLKKEFQTPKYLEDKKTVEDQVQTVLYTLKGENYENASHILYSSLDKIKQQSILQ